MATKSIVAILALLPALTLANPIDTAVKELPAANEPDKLGWRPQDYKVMAQTKAILEEAENTLQDASGTLVRCRSHLPKDYSWFKDAKDALISIRDQMQALDKVKKRGIEYEQSTEPPAFRQERLEAGLSELTDGRSVYVLQGQGPLPAGAGAGSG